MSPTVTYPAERGIFQNEYYKSKLKYSPLKAVPMTYHIRSGHNHILNMLVPMWFIIPAIKDKNKHRLTLLSKTPVVFTYRSRITYSFPSPQNHYLLQACFKSYYRKILSQISSPVNLNRAIIQQACVCYDREVEREKRQTAEQSQELLHETETAKSVIAVSPILCNSLILN